MNIENLQKAIMKDWLQQAKNDLMQIRSSEMNLSAKNWGGSMTAIPESLSWNDIKEIINEMESNIS